MKTTRSILLVTVLTLLSVTTMAQVRLGFRAGSMISTFAEKGNLPDNNNMMASVEAGSFLSVPFSRSLLLQPEINWMSKGRTSETTELGTNLSTDYRVGYLQVPILLQYRDGSRFAGSGSAFYINAGPYAGFALDQKTETSGAGNVSLNEGSRTDWGATLGIGYERKLGKNALRFDLRYDMGLSEIANQPTDYRTKGLSLTLGFVL